ncbi:Ig-like domain-containing protein [Rheinheimera maricola]|uniref:Cadherin-like domain-containing protein n=1 Tax=Rheinheimera maricola TaxID=2793282 RepID=A0ABS7XB44_9GAMM|nr:Ig-like domain-containing protein [Rheinheimera maricola]MBZ9612774.1 cadherin-like domain-containing protein [Rheinheimera maricola]
MKMKHYTLAFSLLCAAVLAGCNSDKKLNSPPQIGANSFVTETDVAIMDRVAAQDADDDMLVFVLGSQPSNGSVTLAADGVFTYTPAAEFTGSDSFTVKVSDGERIAQGLVNISVEVATVSFLSYSRAAFLQPEDTKALPINGRIFTQDAQNEADYADLLTDQ